MGDVTPYALLPGDPARVKRVMEYLVEARQVSLNREYLLVTGLYKGTPITVMSTGMGGVSVAIGIEELVRCGVRYGIRIGSAGSLQSSVHVGDLVIAEGAVRDDEKAISREWSKRGVLASEMETAALFIVGSVRKMHTGSVLNIVVDYGEDTKSGIRSLVEAEEQRKKGEAGEILVALEALHQLHTCNHSSS